jgi:concanavalin A-like lectin/glucanase superfamily protein
MAAGTQVLANVPRYGTGRYGQAIMVEEGTTNLLSANQSSLETDTTGWGTRFTTTISRDTTTATSGSASLKAVMPGSASSEGAETALIAAVPGAFTLSLDLKADSAFALSIGWNYFDSGFGYLATQAASKSLTTSFARYSHTATLPAGTAFVQVVLYTDSALARTFWADRIQIEAKAYATSWQIGGTARNAETLTIPPAGVWNSTGFTAEGWFTPSTAGHLRVVFEAWIDSNNCWVVAVDSGNILYGQVVVGGAPGTGLQGAGALAVGTAYHWALVGDATSLKFYKNGVLAGTYAYTPPGGTLTALYVGHEANTTQANGLIDDLRISNISRTATELLANYNSASAVPLDSYTTYLMRLNSTLDAYKAVT